MAKVKFYRPDFVDETYLEYAVIAARFDGHWVFVRHKDRGTWEIPGGHREPGETALEAARRELWEETGALKADIMPVCVYQVNDDKYGMLFFAGITELGALPAEFEIREILLTDAMPEALTYPGIQPQLFEKVQAWRNLRSSPEEMWDVYDSRRKLTGRLHRRGELLEEGDYHLVVHVWMRNRAGKFLLTKRSPEKGYPNMWETTGGSALAGDDSLTAALREVKEETGLALKPEQGRVLMTYQREDAFVDVWLFAQEHEIQQVHLQPGETTDVMYADLQTIRHLAADGKFVPYPYLEELLRRLEA